MAASTLAQLALQGPAEGRDVLRPGSCSAIRVRLHNGDLQDIRRANELQLVTGSIPHLRIGRRRINLNLSRDDFRNELFASTLSVSPTRAAFVSMVSHRAELKAGSPMSGTDTDAALATLQSSMASYEQEKKARQTNIVNSVLSAPKSRTDAMRQEKAERRRGLLAGSNTSRLASPSLSAAGPLKHTSAPTSSRPDQDASTMQAMKFAIIHLLASRPSKSEEMSEKTHIPKDDLESILGKVAKRDGKVWTLLDRAHKDLDLWKFAYSTEQERKLAVESAIKAYDRLRLGREDHLWQMLLPKHERGKGKVLSKLHLGGSQAPQKNKGLTPQRQASPTPLGEPAHDTRPASAANTPRLGPGSSTPRPSSSAGDIMKRLLSKNPQKARAAAEAKEKKRKQPDGGGSDREDPKPAKRPATKKTKPKPNIKSAEFVHSSDDESDEDGEVKEDKVSDREMKESKGSQPSKIGQENVKPATKPKPKAGSSASPDSSDSGPLKTKVLQRSEAKLSPAVRPSAPKSANPPVKPTKSATPGKSTPRSTTNSLQAPATARQQTQRSPQRPDSKPTVPSPLGAARPRVASDVSDRGAVGVQRVRQGAEQAKGIGSGGEGVKKRHDTVTGADAVAPTGAVKKAREQSATGKPQSPAVIGNGATKEKLANGAKQEGERGVKRKADEPANRDPASAKQHKTDAASWPSQTKASSTINGASHTTPNHHRFTMNPDDDSRESTSAVLDSITFNQGVKLAEDWLKFYPVYSKMHDELTASLARGEKVNEDEHKRFLMMHKRLEQYKLEMNAASLKEHAQEGSAKS